MTPRELSVKIKNDAVENKYILKIDFVDLKLNFSEMCKLIIKTLE